MKQKHFFFALVAMLSFAFSGFAQTTVSSEDELRAALTSSTGGEITLAEDVTLKENIETGNGNYTLDLNNHQIKGDFSGYVLKVGGTLTIKGDGEITGKTTILYCKSGGTINIEGGAIHNNSNNNVIFTVGTLNVYGGSILSTASPNRAIEGAGSGKINLYGGTVTSLVVAKGALNIAGINVTVENGINVGKNAGNVNISAGTIKGDVTIADEAKSKVTISGGSFDDTEAIKDCMKDGSALLQKPDGTYEIVAGQFKVGGIYYPTFAAALNAVEDGQTIELLENATGDEKSTELTFDKDIKFTITGKAPQYALPIVTFQNAEVTIKDAEILIPELDARQNAVINIVNSTVHDAGGNSIAKSYYNGTINITNNSTVYAMQVTAMGYINIDGTSVLNATWQTNVYGNGLIALSEGATFNTAALHLTGQDYSNRDNTDTDRVGKPATIVVDGATLNVGSVKSDNGADYSYNSSKGINVGTIDGKSALLDIKNGGAVNFHMANGQTTNFGAGATVNVAASTLKTISRDANGTVTLANNGKVVVTGNSQLDVKNYSGNAIQLNNGNLVDTYFAGRVDAFGTNNISGTTTIGGILGLGYETNPTEQVVVNITGNFTGTNVLVRTNNGVDNILNVGKADGERTKVHFAQLGAFADVNVVNADVTYGYAFIRNDFNATNSTFEIKGDVNTYFSGNAKVVLDNTTWALPGYANIGSYGGYMYGNADVTLKNGSSMTATNLGVEVSGGNVVKLTLEDNSSLTATKLTNQGSIVLASAEATLNSNECANVTTSVPNQVVSYIDGKYTLVAAIAQIGGTAYTSIDEAFAKATEGQTITLVDNATPVLTSQRAITKAAVIDLDGKTLTLKEDDLYFGTTTFKNGTIVVDPSVKPSTAVFWMFANQTLTFDNVKVVATGVTGTYLIGLEGDNSDLNLLNGSEILVENTTALDLDIICVNGTNTCDIKVENSKVNVTNLDGRVFFRGNYTVKDSEVNLAGITKAGFRIEAGQTLSIEGTSKVNIEGEPRDGGIHLLGATASYTKAKTATVNATVTETGFEAKIGDVKYTTFNEAVAAAQDGAEVTIHKAGTYNVPSGKNLTITGAVDGVQFGPIAEPNLGMKNYTFNNVTFNYANDSHYKGLQYAGEMEYNNCTFNGQVFLYGQKETFKKCTFNQTTNNYNVWTYSAKEVAFNECTFNSAGKSVLIYHESATVFNNVAVANSTFNASQAVEGKAAIEMDASLTAGINLTIDAATTATGFGAGNISGNSLWNNKKGNADDANNDITVVVDGETVLAPVFDAKIGEKGYRNLQDAINAVKDGETVVLAQDFTGNITLTEKVGLHYTIDGAGKTMNGKITITPLSDTNDNRRITIKNIKFVNTADAAVDFISCAVTNHYPRLTVEGCTFTGNGKNTDVALRLKTAYDAVIKDCTGTGLHSFLQNTAGRNLTIENVKVTESKGAFALGTVQGVTIKGSTIDVATYGIRLDADTYNNNAKIESNEVTAFIPVVVRKVNAESNVTFTGENTFTAENTDGKWMVIGTTEYEENGKLPAEVAAGNVVVALNNTNLSYEGVHGAGLAGKGTAEAPYLINNVAELEIFRNSVNAGSAKYSAPGVWVALAADIDMAGENWVGIGSATAEHGFMGNFDGKNFKFKNLTITNPALDSDGYAYAGLFGVTEGTDKDNQNTIKNLTIENVTISTTGDIVSAAIAYPYYTNVDNVKVCGDIKIQGGKYTAGVLAYTRRCVNASNLSIVGNDGSYVKGTQTVGGVISDIQMNGGLTAVYSNFSAEGITVTGEKSVGGIAGIIATQTLNGATVKNVTLNSTDEFAGVVAGRLGGTSTISNVVSENVTGATAVVGATYDGAKAVEARIGDTYYSAFAAAYTAAKAGETVSMLVDLNMSEILVLDKAITLDGNGKTLTSTAGRAINVDCEGNVGIKNLTIDAKGERAINVIQKPANVTIENVTATAANYTVNVAASAATSAGAAKVAISKSTLNGLCTVNVAAAGAQVTVDNSTVNCNDNNTTAGESYAALCLNKAAVGASIVATNTTVNVAAGSDSEKGRNGAENGTVTINGSTEGVTVTVAVITYPGSDNYHGFTSLADAIEFAKAGNTITLIRDVTLSDILVLDKAITLDGNGKTLTSTAGRAINVSGADGVTIKNLTINAKGERAINVIQNATNVTIDNVTATAANYTVNVAASAPNAVVAIKNSTLNGLCTVNVAAAGAQVTVDYSTVNCNDNNTTAGEAYAALCLNKAAVGASIVATNTTVNVAAGSDSEKGRNGAENGTVTINGSTEGVTVTVAVITYPGSDNYHGFTSLADAIEFAKAGNTITLLRDVTMNYNARDAYATQAQNVVVDGNGKTLTLNQTNSDWSSFGLANNSKLVLKNMTIEKTGYGDTNGAWNTHAIIFSCPVEMTDVIVNNSVAVQAGATLNNVTINEAGEYYGLWINGNGQTVTINGGAINATNAGRGIKIADQYIDTPAQVTLSVNGTVFNTAKKAAVLVSSEAGAKIAAANVNIENVAADKVNFVWVDEDWAEHFANVQVEGATVAQEGEGFVAQLSNGASYKTLAAALAAAKDGETVNLLWKDGQAPLAMNGSVFGKNVTITGTAKVDWNKGFLFVGRGGEGNATVTFDGANLTSASNSASYGIHVSGREKNTTNKYDGTLVIKNSTIELDYLINKGAMTLDNATLTVKNGTAIGGRPASETESGADATATVELKNGSKLIVNNHNGMGLGYEAIGVMNIDATSTFETTQSFLVTTKGTMNIAGNASIAGTLTNKGTINLTSENAVLKAQAGLTINSTVEGRDVIYADGVYTTKLGLKGKGTEAEPYLIYNVKELVAFRNSVNEGETKYSAPGVWVALAADIDMAGENWVGIGSATADHGFMGNFDGKNFKFKNLTITDPALDSDGYAYAGLFGVTEGTDKDNQNTIKNLTIENVTINTTGDIVSAAIAYPYYTNVDNVKVCGDIKIQGGKYTAGVLAYTRRCVNASNLSIVGNDGSYVKGTQTVGGVISDIQMNGGLTAVYSNFSAEGITVTGEKSVGGIAGIIATQTLNGATVKNVTLSSQDAFAGVVAGRLGGTSTISNVVSENVTGATAVVGATYDGAKAVAAKIGDTYYSTLEAALAAEGNEVELLSTYEVAAGETKTLDLNGKTVIGTPVEAKAYAVIINKGNLTITGNGSVICNHTLAGSTGYAVNTITNGGTLTIDGATIENKSTAQYQIGYAIDNNSTTGDAIINIKAGKVIASGSSYYDGIRLFCNSMTKKNDVIVSGGEVSTIWMQNPSDGAEKNTKDVAGNVEISGGKVDVLSLEPSANFEAAVTGGHIGEISYFQTAEGRDLVQFVTGGSFDNDVNQFCALGYQAQANAEGLYTVSYTGKVAEFTIVDGQYTDFNIETPIEVGTLTYKRTFPNVGKWNALYVPFEIPVSVFGDDYKVAYLNDIHSYDENKNGIIETSELTMEGVYITDGTLRANHPYVIIPQNEESKDFELVLNDVTLQKTSAENQTSVDFSSAYVKYCVRGTYVKAGKAELNNGADCFVLSADGVWGKLSETAKLGAFRIYFTMENKDGSPVVISENAEIRVRIAGEEDQVTGIFTPYINNDVRVKTGIFDLMGRPVVTPEKGKIYIIDGKKVLY